MAELKDMYKFIRKVHVYSAFLITGSLIMYILTGFMMTRHNLWKPGKDISSTVEHELVIPENLDDNDLPAFIAERFGISGHKGKPSVNNKGIITIQYVKPGIKNQAIIAADKKSVKIIKTETAMRATITTFHRLKGYGGGLAYDLYVLMTDLVATGILIFSVTGVIVAFMKRGNPLLKILVLAAGVTYTAIVIISFIKG
jgi:hypothetical protein